MPVVNFIRLLILFSNISQIRASRVKRRLDPAQVPSIVIGCHEFLERIDRTTCSSRHAFIHVRGRMRTKSGRKQEQRGRNWVLNCRSSITEQCCLHEEGWRRGRAGRADWLTTVERIGHVGGEVPISVMSAFQSHMKKYDSGKGEVGAWKLVAALHVAARELMSWGRLLPRSIPFQHSALLNCRAL